MKREMALVRRILTWAIEQPNGFMANNPSFDGVSEEAVGYHIHLMKQAGLVEAADATNLGSPSPMAILLNVTWDGHDFADAVKDEQLWRKASSTILKEGASFSFELLKEWLKSEAKIKLGLS